MRLGLILMRHGEAEDGPPTGAKTDRARRLTKRGTAEARSIARQLVQRGLTPTLTLSSDAVRAEETAGLVATSRAVDKRLYLAGLDTLKDVLATVDAAQHTLVMLIGHNPGFSTAAFALTGDWLELGTAGTAHLEVEADTWPEALAQIGSWDLAALITPIV